MDNKVSGASATAREWPRWRDGMLLDVCARAAARHGLKHCEAQLLFLLAHIAQMAAYAQG